MQTDRNSAPTPLSALHRMLLYAEMAILVGLPHMQYMLLVCALNKVRTFRVLLQYHNLKIYIVVS